VQPAERVFLADASGRPGAEPGLSQAQRDQIGAWVQRVWKAGGVDSIAGQVVKAVRGGDQELGVLSPAALSYLAGQLLAADRDGRVAGEVLSKVFEQLRNDPLGSELREMIRDGRSIISGRYLTGNAPRLAAALVSNSEAEKHIGPLLDEVAKGDRSAGKKELIKQIFAHLPDRLWQPAAPYMSKALAYALASPRATDADLANFAQYIDQIFFKPSAYFQADSVTSPAMSKSPSGYRWGTLQIYDHSPN
jgi:hypothetical protein